MIAKDRIVTISKLAFPITIALGFASMMSLVNLLMVGTLGTTVVAAVGLSGFTVTLIFAVVEGIMPAVQGLVARRRGEGSTEPKCLALNGGLLISLIVGIPLTIVFYLCIPFLFSLISSDPEVIKIGVPFLRIESSAFVAIGMMNAFDGHWAGMEKPTIYMSIGLFMNVLNIFLNYVFIFGHFGIPALGAKGAAIGWVISLYAGLIANFAITCLRFSKDGFLSAKPDRSLLKSVLKLAVPATLLQIFGSAGYVVFFWMVGQVGTTELAAASVLARIALLLTLLAISLGMASATLVSKSVGEGNLAAAAEWGWDTAKLGVIVITLLGLPLFLFPEWFLSVFLANRAAISIAVIPLRIVAATNGIGSLVYILAYALSSVGDGNRVMMIAFGTQWIFFLPAVWIVGPLLKYGLLQIWLVQLAYSILATVLITAIWVEGRWKKIKI